MPRLEETERNLSALVDSVQGDLFGADPRARTEFKLRDHRLKRTLQQGRAARAEQVLEVLDKIKFTADVSLQKGDHKDARDGYSLWLSYMAPKLNGVMIQSPNGAAPGAGGPVLFTWQPPVPEDDSRVIDAE
jgi:hypothetical protein